MLSPAETKALYPLMNVDDLYGTLYVPQDGTMDPAGTCTALSRAAAARGAQVVTATGPCVPAPSPKDPEALLDERVLSDSHLCFSLFIPDVHRVVENIGKGKSAKKRNGNPPKGTYVDVLVLPPNMF